ncbi:hypothetical protein WBP07_18520 [Novosphingobium sp. BL-8A]|uniref:hypothetical protein n=1 Tax=Novosphingobium sp. BL-8A TaxID=3127639 RepID=UPI003756777F
MYERAKSTRGAAAYRLPSRGQRGSSLAQEPIVNAAAGHDFSHDLNARRPSAILDPGAKQ